MLHFICVLYTTFFFSIFFQPFAKGENLAVPLKAGIVTFVICRKHTNIHYRQQPQTMLGRFITTYQPTLYFKRGLPQHQIQPIHSLSVQALTLLQPLLVLNFTIFKCKLKEFILSYL